MPIENIIAAPNKLIISNVNLQVGNPESASPNWCPRRCWWCKLRTRPTCAGRSAEGSRWWRVWILLSQRRWSRWSVHQEWPAGLPASLPRPRTRHIGCCTPVRCHRTEDWSGTWCRRPLCCRIGSWRGTWRRSVIVWFIQIMLKVNGDRLTYTIMF